MSMIAPDLTSRVAKQSLVHNNVQKTDIHIHGGNAEAIAKETMRHMERHQRQMTTALQTGNSQEAY
jgi:hypothetical protein